MPDRLDPVDEAQRLYALMTASERVRFLAWLTSPPTLCGVAPEGPAAGLLLDSAPGPHPHDAAESGRKEHDSA